MLKVAINGFGRIGRSIAKIILSRDDILLVAINDLTDIESALNLFKFDSVQGELQKEIKILEDSYFEIDNKKIKYLSIANREILNFKEFGADLVFECTGLFLNQETTIHHLNKGIKNVIISAPANDSTKTFVLGVNHHNYNGEQIISNASCTTNALAPILKIMDEHIGVEKGVMTTIHSYTNDQNLLDGKHTKDKRRARAGAINIIPTTTGAAKAIYLVLPQFKNRLHGQSVRVPVPNVSMIDLNLVLSKNITEKEIVDIFTHEISSRFKNILDIDKDYRVSTDFMQNPHSGIIPIDLIQVINGNLVKIMIWYDNEWGYSNRLVEMALYISKFKGEL